MLLVRPADPADAAALAPRLREADLREIQAAVGLAPAAVLAAGVARSVPCHAVTDGGTVIAVFGVVPDARVEDAGMVWLLGSEAIVAHAKPFLRQSGAWIERLHERYRVLWSVVDARNVVHLRWLRFCGFEVLRRLEHHGVEGRPFHEVQHERRVLASPAQGDSFRSGRTPWRISS